MLPMDGAEAKLLDPAGFIIADTSGSVRSGAKAVPAAAQTTAVMPNPKAKVRRSRFVRKPTAL